MKTNGADRKGDTLRVWGRTLFAEGRLTDHLEAQVLAQVRHVYATLAAARPRLSKLQVRRRFEGSSFPGAVTITPEPTITLIDGDAPDSLYEARHVSAIEGDPAYLEYAPSSILPRHLPRAVIDERRLVLTVHFEEADRPFVPLLVQAELELIMGTLAEQREVLARFNAGLPDLVRRLVATEWEALTAG